MYIYIYINEVNYAINIIRIHGKAFRSKLPL